MNITLRPIDETNREAVLALDVREDQPFVAPNDVSLRQADEANAENPGVARPFAIYADEEPVGFCMFAFDPSDEDPEDRYYIWRFMIDKRYQHRGYGREALQCAIDFIKTFPCGEAEYCVLSYYMKNQVARRFYCSFGFTELNEPGYYEEGDEISAVLKL